MSKLYAVVRRGNRRGQKVEISQWCNNWMSLADGTICAPSTLAFTVEGIRMIESNKNNGTLFDEFHACSINGNSYPESRYGANYCISFTRRRV